MVKHIPFFYSGLFKCRASTVMMSFSKTSEEAQWSYDKKKDLHTDLKKPKMTT